MNRVHPAARHGLSRAVAVCCGLLLAASLVPSSASDPRAAGRVLTLVDYFEGGQRAVEEFLDSGRADLSAPDLRALIRDLKRRCARVELRSGAREAGYESIGASGVLVDRGRRLLTAGHVFAGQTDFTIVVTLTDGRSYPGQLIAWQYTPDAEIMRDWAVVEILGAAPAAPAMPTGRLEEGDLAIVLGYPDRIGLDARGDVAYAATDEGAPLDPLVTIGEVKRTAPTILTPVVGAVPLTGMSGGPVFNARGELTGLFASILRGVSRSGTTWAYRVVDPGDVTAGNDGTGR